MWVSYRHRLSPFAGPRSASGGNTRLHRLTWLISSLGLGRPRRIASFEELLAEISRDLLLRDVLLFHDLEADPLVHSGRPGKAVRIHV